MFLAYVLLSCFVVACTALILSLVHKVLKESNTTDSNDKQD